MPFDWRDYLALAKSLQASPPASVSKEAVDRATISRAYYAAFCFALNYARDRHQFVVKGNGADHGNLLAHFRNRSAHADIAQRLGALRDWRNTCDYDDLSGVDAVMVRFALTKADEIIKTLEKKHYP